MTGIVYSAMPIEEFLDMLRKAAEQRNDYPFIDKIDEILVAITDADRCDNLAEEVKDLEDRNDDLRAELEEVKSERNDLRLEIENMELEMAAERDRK